MHSSPWASSKAVFSEAGASARVIGGYGSGLIDLQFTDLGTGGTLAPWNPSNRDLTHFNANGVVREIVAFPDKIYAAAGTNGVVRIDRATGAVDLVLVPVMGRDVVAVDVIRDAGRDVVVAGTNAGDVCGTVAVFDTSLPPGAMQVWQSYPVAPVLSIAAVLDEIAAGQITVFAGAACSKIYAIHFDATQTPLPPPNPSSWAGSLDVASTVSELQVHVEGPTDKRLYASELNLGTFAYSIGVGPSLEVTLTPVGGDWPLQASVPSGSSYYSWDISYEEDPATGRDFLAIGLGHNSNEQHTGNCDEYFPCGLVRAQDPADLGVITYDVTDLLMPDPLGQHLASVDLDKYGYTCWGVDLRVVSSSKYFVDVAAGGGGARTWRADENGAIWDELEIADWSSNEPDASGVNFGVPLTTNNTLAKNAAGVFSGPEGPLPVWERNPTDPDDFLRQPEDIEVWLGNPAEPSGLGASVLTSFASGDQGGPAVMYGINEPWVTIYDIEGANLLHPQHGAEPLLKPGDGLFGRTMPGLLPPGGGPATRWLALGFNQYFGAAIGKGGVSIVNVGFGTDGSAPGIVDVFTLSPADLLTRCFDVLIRPIDASSAWLYSTYTTLGNGGTIPPQVGILRLKLRAKPSGQIAFTDLMYLPAKCGSEVVGGQAARLSLDSENGFVCAALGCNGWAIYGDPTPTEGVRPGLLLLDEPPKWMDATKKANVFQVEPAYDSSFTGNLQYYVSMIDGQLEVVSLQAESGEPPPTSVECPVAPDPVGLVVSSTQVFRTRYQAIGFLVEEDRRSVLLADGQGGIVHLYFDPLEFP